MWLSIISQLFSNHRIFPSELRSLSFIFIIITIAALPVLSQQRFQKAYGSAGDEYGRGITMDNNGNLVMLTQLNNGSDNDFGIMILSKSGIILSSYKYYIPGNQEASHIEKTADGGYLIAGTDNVDVNRKTFVCRVNASYEVVWLRIISTQYDMYCALLTQDHQANIYMSLVCIENNIGDIALTKFDSSGTLLWKRTLGSNNTDHIWDIHFSEDGTLNCIGDLWSGGSQLTLIQISPDNVILNQQSLFQDQHYYPFEVVDLENDEFLIISNDLLSSRTALIKMNSSLKPVWQQSIGGNTPTGNINIYLDGGYFSEGNVYLIGTTDHNGGDIIVVSIDTDGFINWGKTYGGSELEKTDRPARKMIYADENGLFFGGRTNSFGAGGNDIYLVGADLEGFSGCYEHEISVSNTPNGWSPYPIDIVKNFNVYVAPGDAQKQPANWLLTETMCPGSLQASFTANQQSICQGDSITFTDLTNNAPTSWNWVFEGGTPAASNLQNPAGIVYKLPGSFDVTLIVSNGQEYDTLTLENYIQAAPVTQVDLGADQCLPPDGYLPLYAGEGFSQYHWSNGVNGANWIIADEPGIYWVTVTNQFGCEAADSIVILPGFDILPDLGPDQSLCDGQVITLNAGSGYEAYFWSNGATSAQLEISTPGVYWVRVSNDSGCEATDTIQITYGLYPALDLGMDITLCQINNLIIDAGPGYASYLWSDGSTSQSISVTGFGKYWVRVEDIYGCIGSDTLYISLKTININLGEDINACQGESIVLDAGNSYSGYLWSTGGTTAQIEVEQSGTFWLQVTDSEQCKGADTIEIVFSDPPYFSSVNRLSAGRVMLAGGGGTPPYEYSTDGTSFQNSGEFSVQTIDYQKFYIRDAQGCLNDTLVFFGEVNLMIPNFFTPNGDFNHDTWEIEGIHYYPDAVVNIFDRYGKLVASYNGVSNGWDGKSNGKPLPSDTYWYQIIFPAYVKKPVTGDVTIKR